MLKNLINQLTVKSDSVILTLAPFFLTHPPTGERAVVSKTLVKQFRGVLPDSLLALWQAHGLGFYGEHLLQLINPNDYKDNLYDWMMREDCDEDNSRIPFAISATGMLFYFRLLSDDGDVDVSYIDPHTSDTGMITYAMDEFFNSILCTADGAEDYLNASVVQTLRKTLGDLALNQMYYYVPALRVGGAKNPKNMDKGDAYVHLDFLLQLALSQ